MQLSPFFFQAPFSRARPVFKPYIYGFSAGEKRQLSLLSAVVFLILRREKVHDNTNRSCFHFVILCRENSNLDDIEDGLRVENLVDGVDDAEDESEQQVVGRFLSGIQK